MLVFQASRSRWAAFIAAAIAVATVSWAIAASPYFAAHSGVLSVAIAVDLVLVVPLVYWAALVRRHGAPARTLIPVVVLCILAASALIPAGNARALSWARTLAMPAEVGLLMYLAYKLRRFLAARPRSGGDDPVEGATAALESALGLPFVARLMASEFSVFYYALASWRRRPQVTPGAFAFAPARAGTVLAVLVPILLLETALMHAVVSRWSPTAAWVLTALSAYSVLWVFGDYRAMALRPTLVTPDGLFIRVGLRCSLRAPFSLIERVEAATWRAEAGVACSGLNMAAPDSPNVLIRFRKPITAQRLLGIETPVRSVGLRVLDPDGLIRLARRGALDSCPAHPGTPGH